MSAGGPETPATAKARATPWATSSIAVVHRARGLKESDMDWPSMIPQPTAVPVVMVGTTVDIHGAMTVAGYLVLLAAMALGLAILGFATRD